MPYMNSKDADQTVQLHSLASTFIIHILDSMKPTNTLYKIARL